MPNSCGFHTARIWWLLKKIETNARHDQDIKNQLKDEPNY